MTTTASTTRPPRRRRALALVGLLATTAIVAACTDESRYAAPTSTTPELRTRPIAALVAYDRCSDHLAWIKAQAMERVGPWGLTDGPVTMYGRAGGFTAVAEDAAAGRAAAPNAASEASEDLAATGTNNQEAGVDEADLVKTDGRRVVTAIGRRVTVSLIDGPARLAGTVDLDLEAQSMLLVGDRAFVIGSPVVDPGDPGAPPRPGGPGIPEPMPMPIDGGPDVASSRAWIASPDTRIAEVDLSGDTPRLADATTVEGQVTAGRLAGGAVRLVLQTQTPTALEMVMPQMPNGEAAAEAQNRAAIERSTIDDWLPARIAADGGRTPLVPCDAMYHPAEFSGFSTLSVLTITGGLDSLSAVGLAAAGGVTYASPSSLYVATSAFDQGAQHTDLHRFDIATDGPATYLASGRVPGTAIGQYAMSEHEGDLRIATTTEGPTDVTVPACPPNADCAVPPVGRGDGSSSRVTVLRTSGPALTKVGEVVGLGPTERITGVRFDGTRAYVVTFRRTDPLYVLDLTDPTAPKVLGELKVTGFSDYLHPVGDDLVLGVGSEATDDGRVTGAKIALYDTSDPTNPVELDRLLVEGGQLAAGYDPHAFTWDPERRTATVLGNWYDEGRHGQGAISVRVDGNRLAELGRLAPEGFDSLLRTFVAADRLWSLSPQGLTGHDPTTLAVTDRVGFA
jgi:hypothetical protein